MDTVNDLRLFLAFFLQKQVFAGMPVEYVRCKNGDTRADQVLADKVASTCGAVHPMATYIVCGTWCFTQ